jgi:biopolymer transport protein TolQ
MESVTQVSQALTNPVDLSLTVLILRADPVVKGVMAVLVIFSIWCWAIMVEKMLQLLRTRRGIVELETTVQNSIGAALVGMDDDNPHANIIAAGVKEWRDNSIARDESPSETRERIERSMRVEVGYIMRNLEKRLPFLATVGSAAPFVGLFGTVWGIMHSFTSIAKSHDTSLAVVAPGIAEALLATAIGLAAAIPAVMAYNKFAVDFGICAARLQSVIAEYGGRLAKINPAAAANRNG